MQRRPAKKRRTAEAAAAQAPPGGAPERVQKILARAGLASRREAEEWIRAGRVTINGAPAELGSRAQGSDQIRLDGRLVRQAPSREGATFLCNRSPGEPLLRADEGSGHEPFAARLPRKVGRRYLAISPLPRIDGGLELVTSDGALAARLQRAVRGLAISFQVRVRGELTPEQVAGVLEGQLDSGARLQVLECEPGGGEGTNRWYRVETRGATGGDLRAVVERQGATVSRLMRVAMGALALDRSLPRGQWRALGTEDLAALLEPAEQAVPGFAADATGSPEPGR
ncbi:MAG: S4 domain-containing protein [Steroidobacteraceae bacterium]